MYICPFCTKEFDTLKDLKIHFKKHNISYCQLCKKYYKKPLEHYVKTKDEKHLVLYYLATNLYKNHKPNSKLFKIALDKAKKLVRK